VLEKERERVFALKLGDESVFREIMEQWYSRLFNFANGYLNNHENTKEIIQDVFLQLWNHRSRLAENTSLNAYLFTLTRNRCIDRIRSERRALQFYSDKQEEYIHLTENYNALSDSILDNIFAMELQAEIDSAVALLPDQCQKVFLLSRNKGLKNREISETLSISEKTVESHITKALQSIRSALERKLPSALILIMILKKAITFPNKK
jgi:RNA polymerase sigma-70 factor (ECF subfamily)